MAADKQKPIGSGFNGKSVAADVMAGIDLTGASAIVTGGYSGLGLETVKALVHAGAKVLVPARRPDAAQDVLDAAGSNVTVMQMDLADPASIRRFANDVADLGQPVDILINNAAIMACPETRVGPGFEAQFAVNHLGHFLMTTLLIDSIMRADAPRIVSLSSIGHKQSDIRWHDVHFESEPYNKWQAYGQAKTANSLFALGLQQRFGTLGLDAFAVHPGGIMTPLQRHLTNDEMVTLGWTKEDGALSETAAQIFKSPAGGAATSVWCATAPQLAGRGGVYCEDCDIAEMMTGETPRYLGVAPWAVDEDSADKLWRMSEKMLDL